MEYKVGEIFELDGKKYQAVERVDGLRCENCCFKNSMCWQLNTGSCIKYHRKDRRDVCFKLVEQ